jgi:6-pyruvoyltetrahydropterin/6-carboxytetrahydropterin synthase
MSEEMIARIYRESQNGREVSDNRQPTTDPFFTASPPLRIRYFLRAYAASPSRCGHYKVGDLAARRGGVDSDAIAVDFVSARRKLEALAKRLDYGCINDVPPFDEINPSAENIAEWFADQLGEAVAGEDAVVQAVTIWEGPVNSVTFRP